MSQINFLVLLMIIIRYFNHVFFMSVIKIKLFIFYIYANLDFIILRFFYCLLEVIKIPYEYNYFPQNNGIFYFLNLKGSLLEISIYLLPFLILSLFFNFQLYKENYKLFLLFIIWLIYFSLIVSFQFFGKNFFHLEIFSIIIFAFTIGELIKLIKKI